MQDSPPADRRLLATPLGHGLIELCWRSPAAGAQPPDLAPDTEQIQALHQAVRTLAADTGLAGVLVSFQVTADADADAASSSQAQARADDLPSQARWSALSQALLAFEDLPVPTVAAISGEACGAALALALAASQRLVASDARLCWPEVALGGVPGGGATVRLCRLAGLAGALDWVCHSRAIDADTALQAGVVDALAAPADLRAEALRLLAAAVQGQTDWQRSQQRKRQPLLLATDAADSVTEPTLLQLRARHPPHQPAAQVAAEMMRAACLAPHTVAHELELQAIAEVAPTQAATALWQAARNERLVRQRGIARAAQARPLHHAAVLGAGAMGGEIALSAALAGMQVRMKDIVPAPLEVGMANARRQLDRLRQAGRLTATQADATLAAITPQRDDKGFEQTDLVIEAVAENLPVKRALLQGLQAVLPPGAILASNTSSLGIDDLAESLDKPGRLVGMHFFNPASLMPLVEVIPGRRTDPQVVTDAVACCVAMGKVPIVAQDRPGFLVNRVFTAFMRGFLELLVDGADIQHVDRAMQAFGWPLGPAALHDMLGIDICNHACDTISAGYAGHMPVLERSASRLLVAAGRLGCKSGAGFYRYDTDGRGRQRRSADPQTVALLAPLQAQGPRHHADADIVDRIMVPLVLEAIRALDDGIVDTAAELDTALLMGLGLPAYLGGALVYADWLGADELLRRSDRLAALGPMYQAPDRLRQMQRCGQTFYPA